uniref:Uncharacterized protein n=1 Tax=Geospiza parvula TaxID=87175 RepID=A0A8U8BNX7_GEOPR
SPFSRFFQTSWPSSCRRKVSAGGKIMGNDGKRGEGKRGETRGNEGKRGEKAPGEGGTHGMPCAAVTVTLDPSTAHPQLLVAPDGSSVSWERAQGPPGAGAGAEPKAGASSDPAVLGREGVTGGRRCWDVQVAPEGSWALGVARETPGSGAGTPENGERTPGSGFWALTSLERVPLSLARAPSRVRVALDYERGHVAFFDADRRSLIFAFPAASFQGQRVPPPNPGGSSPFPALPGPIPGVCAPEEPQAQGLTLSLLPGNHAALLAVRNDAEGKSNFLNHYYLLFLLLTV